MCNCTVTLVSSPSLCRHPCKVSCSLQHTATHCNTTHGSTLQHNMHLNMEREHAQLHRDTSVQSLTVSASWQGIASPALHCSTLQHTAAHCSTLQHTTAHCTKLHHTAPHCTTLHHAATRCNTLQHTATYCNTPQHTTYILSLHFSLSQCTTLPSRPLTLSVSLSLSLSPSFLLSLSLSLSLSLLLSLSLSYRGLVE